SSFEVHRMRKHLDKLLLVAAVVLGLLVGFGPLIWGFGENVPEMARDLGVIQQEAAPGPAPLEVGDSGQRHFGYTPNPREQQRFLRSLPHRNLREAAPQLFQK